MSAGSVEPGARRRRPRIDVLVALAAILLINGIVPIPVPAAIGPDASGVTGATDDPFEASPSPITSGTPGGSGSAGSPGPSGPVGSAPSPTPRPETRSVIVHSIPDLLARLADDRLDEIIVADGTYRVNPSGQRDSNSLWIDGRFANRTRPITVRAETRGGVVFEGSGGAGYGGLSFEDGAHDQTWDGFTFADMAADRSGIVEIGGYAVRRAPHHLTIRNIRILGSCTGSATSHSAPALDHGVYIANALDPGPHDITFESIAIDGRGGLASGFQFYHSEAGAPNASNLTVRNLRVTGSQQALIFWDPTLRDVTFDGVTIRDALNYAVRYETTGSQGVVLHNVLATGSGFAGFYSTLGASPPGITITDSSIR